LLGTDLTKDKKIDFLNSLSSGLTPIDASAINKKAMYGKILCGFGLNKIPETVQFGKKYYVIKKLYIIILVFLLKIVIHII
jgi:hypothetical protein